VHSIWEQQSDSPARLQILPSGYVELIFNTGPAVDELNGKLVGANFNPTENFCFLSGLHTKPLGMHFSRFRVMGMQMHPLAVKGLFGIPCKEVQDWAIPGELILQDLAEIEDQLRMPGSFLSKAQWLESYLLRKIQDTSELQTAFKIRQSLQKAKQAARLNKRVKIEALTGYSRMHTSRLFKDWFGLAPAQTLRLHQFTDAVQCLHLGAASLTEIGLQSGFYDQPHFIRIFHEFADMAPGEYKKQMVPGLVGQLLS
jgi:AraC-like DNA-binding protein